MGSSWRSFLSDECLTFVGVTLPKEVYIQNHRLGFVLLFAQGLALVLCIHTILNAPEKGWLRNELPIGGVYAWAENGNYIDQSIADLGAPFCNETINEKFNYWYSATWTYTNMSCRSLPPGERSMKLTGEIYVPTYFTETFGETQVASKVVGNGSCISACRLQGNCTNIVDKHVGSKVFESTGSMNSFGECLCKCESSHNVFAVGASALRVVIETQAKVREDPNLDTFQYYVSNGGEDVLTVVKFTRDGKAIESRRFLAHEPVSLTVAEWLELGGVRLDDLNEETVANQNKNPKYTPFPSMRITGVDVTLSANYHNKLDPAHNTPDWDGPVAYIKVSVKKVWASKPIMDWGAVEDARGVGSHRYRYYYGVRFQYSSHGHFSFWNPIGVFTIIASGIVYLKLPLIGMRFLVRYGSGAFSSIYRKAQMDCLETGDMFLGLLCRALAGTACYDMLLNNQRRDEKDEFAVEVTDSSLRTQLKALFEKDDRLDEKEMGVIMSLLGGLETTTGVVTREKFVDIFTNTASPCNLRELADFYDFESEKTGCMAVFDSGRLARRRSLFGETESKYKNDEVRTLEQGTAGPVLKDTEEDQVQNFVS